jgi:hypothetical protein
MVLNNPSLQKFLDKRSRLVVGIFFAAFLLIGLGIYKDYGLSWDEMINHDNGTMAFNYAFKGDRSLLTYTDRYYGVAFELPLIMIEKFLKLETPRGIFLMRHLATFLMFFLGVVFFYRLSRDHFRSWKIGLLGSLLLILSPRLFAESFYNSKDLVFLSLFTISIYTLVQFLEKTSLFRAAGHALVCALLIDVRVLGVLVPGLTLLFVLADSMAGARSQSPSLRKGILSLVLFFALTSGLVVLFWPILWKNPLGQFIQALRTMSRFPWDWAVLYRGRYLTSSSLPWHYIPVWMLITTPLLYGALFLVGVFRSFVEIIKRRFRHYLDNKKRNDFLFLSWFFIPLLAVIVFRSVVYDSWRHLYFIYPAFLMMSLKGMLFLWVSLKSLGRSANVLRPIYILIIFWALAHTAAFMIANHPFQNVYFNSLAGSRLRANWELDYWGLSYRQALEYILRHDRAERISVYVANYPGELNQYILKLEDRKRLAYSPEPEGAAYVLSNYRWHREDYPYLNEFYSITVGRAKIISVFKLK